MSDGTDQLRSMVRMAISDAYYNARNKGETMEVAADTATASVMNLCSLVHENARRYGEIVGEMKGLDAALSGTVSDREMIRRKAHLEERIREAKK